MENKWIKVTDRLPEFEQDVLLIDNDCVYRGMLLEVITGKSGEQPYWIARLGELTTPYINPQYWTPFIAPDENK